MTLQSIDHIRTAQRKRPRPINVMEYASRHFGLNMSEGQEYLNSLVMLRTVYNKPTSLHSLLKKTMMLTTQK